MAVPDYQEMMLPVLRLIATGHKTIPSCLGPLAKEFGPSDEETEELLPSGKQTKLANRAHWARNYMSQAGLVEAERRGSYVLTRAGRAVLGRNPEKIDKEYLKEFQAFQEFLGRSNRGAEADDALSASVQHSSESASVAPDELIATAHTELTDALASDLLDLCLALDPSRFEQLIVDLLLAMGYGGGDERMGRQLGRSGDGGIDGVIDEDALGLDAVYVQAKRYAPENTVGRPAIQQFIGSLTGEGASKGVFVTTSSFSAEARDYAARVMQRVVLIDGARLARLMIRHGVGVRTRRTYEVKSIDEDYFGEPS